MYTDEQQRDGIKEAIKFNTELIRIFTIIIIALATGVSSLIIKITSTLGIRLLIISGSLVLVIFVALIIILVLSNKRKLKTLRND